MGQLCFFLLFLANIIWTCLFFSIYLRPDIRVTATNWINNNLSSKSILLESGNMLDIPLRGNLKKTSLDFYKLENNLDVQNQLIKELVDSDYFIIQSRRVFLNHMRLGNQYPLTAQFYQLLFDGSLGFKLVKKLDSYPQINIANFNLIIDDEQAEETWSVFDHPVIRIYQKTNKMSQEAYQELIISDTK